MLDTVTACDSNNAEHQKENVIKYKTEPKSEGRSAVKEG